MCISSRHNQERTDPELSNIHDIQHIHPAFQNILIHHFLIFFLFSKRHKVIRSDLKVQKFFCVSFSRTYSGMVKFQLLAILLFVLFWKFFKTALADGFSQEFQGLQVSTSLQDSSQYSDQFQYCSSLDGLHLSCYFQVLAPITIGSIVPFMFYSFFNSLVGSKYLPFFSHSFNFQWFAGTAKSTILQVLFFLVDYCMIWSSGRDLVIRLYLEIPFSRMDSGLYVYHLFVWSKFNFW